MITLITFFYAFLIPMNEPAKTACQGKLEELNYVYEYNQEPASQNPFHRFKIDTIPLVRELEIKSIYNCFKHALEIDTNKVLLVSFNNSVPRKEIIETQASKNIIYLPFLRITPIINFYSLEKYNVYYSYDENLKSRVTIKLLDINDTKTNFLITTKRYIKFIRHH